MPSHSSTLSSVMPEVHRLDVAGFRFERGSILPCTMFSVARDAGFATAVFVSKAKLRHVTIPGSLDFWAHWSCECMAEATASYLRTAPAGITFAHSSEAYLAAVQRMDACFGVILDAIKRRPDANGAHGTQQPVDLRMPWNVWGAHVRRGSIGGEVRRSKAATALTAPALTLPTPTEALVGAEVFGRR